VVAVVAYWRNRYQAVGPLFGLAMLVTSVWYVGFAQYFHPMEPRRAIFWATVTLSLGITNTPLFFHSVCAVLGQMRRSRWWIVASYVTATICLILLWKGQIVTGLNHPPYMDHYVRYNRSWYPFLIGHINSWQWLSVVFLVSGARNSVGYKRTQCVYFTVAWCIVFLTGNLIIVPLEYGINIQPFGFFIMPVNFMLVAYVMSKARFADFNVVIARALIYALTLLIVVAASLVFAGGMTLVAPSFMDQQQMLFMVAFVAVIGMGLAATLPRFLPRAERMMQERMFGKRYGYQDVLSGLVKELSHLPSIEQILATVVTKVHSEMQLSRAMILLQNPLSDDYKLIVESGLSAAERADSISLTSASAIIRWLEEAKDTLVRDELPRRVDTQTLRKLEAELDPLRISVCVPMILDGQLVGLIGLGEKTSKDMFFVSDLRLLENLGTEVALAVKYRRMEEEILRKNKLTELGTIAAGVAHEIRNPLASIKTFAQLLPSKSDDPEFRNEFSKLVVKDVERITKVVETMLAFARPSEVKVANYSAAELVEEAVLLVQPRLKSKSIELTKQFHEQPVLRVDKQQILQVLVNLLNNAVDALPEHGKIRVATGVRTMEDAEEGNGSQRSGVIEVADNGPGMAAAIRNRLFDPFFTTKREGTGLGLSISQKIVRDHGGIITVSSIEGKGTTFQVNLPLN